MSEDQERRDTLMMLNMLYDQAVKDGRSEFSIHQNNVDGIAHYQDHIRQFELQHGGKVTHKFTGLAIAFRILP